MSTPTDRRYRQGHRMFNALLVAFLPSAWLLRALADRSVDPDPSWLDVLGSFALALVCTVVLLVAVAVICRELAKPCAPVDQPGLQAAPAIPRTLRSPIPPADYGWPPQGGQGRGA